MPEFGTPSGAREWILGFDGTLVITRGASTLLDGYFCAGDRVIRWNTVPLLFPAHCPPVAAASPQGALLVVGDAAPVALANWSQEDLGGSPVTGVRFRASAGTRTLVLDVQVGPWTRQRADDRFHSGDSGFSFSASIEESGQPAIVPRQIRDGELDVWALENSPSRLLQVTGGFCADVTPGVPFRVSINQILVR